MGNMFIENKSRFNLDETVSKLIEAIGKHEWKLIHTHDLQQIMMKNGKEVLPVKVMEICAPKHAYKLLSSDNERLYSNMMPCRLSVFERSDGITYVSRMNTGQFASSLGGVVADVMTESFHEAEQIIAHVI